MTRPRRPDRPSPTQPSIRSPFGSGDRPYPRHVEDELWDPQAAAWVPRPSVLWALLVGALAGVLAGILLAGVAVLIAYDLVAHA